MKKGFDFDSFREVGDALMRNRSRSLLTGFGIFWGLFMLLFLVGAGDGFKTLVYKNFEGFASNAAIMVPANTSVPYKGYREGRYWNLDRNDVERLRLMVPELGLVCPQIAEWGLQAVRGTNHAEVTVKGVNDEYRNVETPKLMWGRYLNPVDVEQERKVCVIGKRIYEDLFPEGGNPCGQFIQIGGVYFQIIGVDEAAGDISVNSSNSVSAVIPVTVASKLYHRGNKVDIICAVGKSGVRMSLLEEKIRETVGRAHTFDPEDREAMQYLNTEEIFTIVDNLFRGLKFLIWLVGLGTLLAGAVGVSNIMMVTVRERTTETGIRRAIGAMPRDILIQIINESVTLTALAGTVSIVFTSAVLALVEVIAKHQAAFQISFGTATLALVVLGALGVAAGLAPALSAIKIKPVDAMRDE